MNDQWRKEVQTLAIQVGVEPESTWNSGPMTIEELEEWAHEQNVRNLAEFLAR